MRRRLALRSGRRRSAMHRYVLLGCAGLALAVLVSAVLQPDKAWASVPYETYYKDHYNQQYRIQTAYRPAGALGRELLPLNNPQDLFIDSQDHLYIADTNNNRIVHLDSAGALLRILDFPDNPLNRPQGLYVHDNGDVYIADTGNQRVLRVSAEGEVLAEFGRPESKLLPDSFRYDPVKLVVDKRGFLYIATLGGYQGLLQLDPQGGFKGFFGVNQTAASFIDSVKRLLYTREMYEREISRLPGAITSVDQSADGFIYTVTREVQTGQIKKLNIAGLDQLAGKGEYADAPGADVFGETIRRPFAYTRISPQLNDLAVDGDGNITVVDARLNVVSQYDNNGNLLFYWGGSVSDTTNKLGLVRTPAAIATDSANHLYILDSENNVVQKYETTAFGALVHQANRLTQDGRYEESAPYWQEVYRLNAHYTPALLGLAQAAYKRGDYAEAQRLFKAAGWGPGYSDAFWQNRLLWFQSQFGLFMNAGLATLAGVILLRKGNRRWSWGRRLRRLADLRSGGRRHASESVPVSESEASSALPARVRAVSNTGVRLAGQLAFVRYLIRHPLDGFYGIRHEGKASVGSGTLVLLLALVAYGYFYAGTSFIYNPAIIVDAGLVTPLLRFVLLWLGFVAASYLVSSLNQGEGRLRDVYTASAYALFPFVLIGVPLTALSTVLTLNESAIYHFFAYGMYGWVGLLLFWQVQGVHNFSVGETVKTLLLTVVTLFIMAIVLFISFSLTSEFVRFIYAIYQEVTIR